MRPRPSIPLRELFAGFVTVFALNASAQRAEAPDAEMPVMEQRPATFEGRSMATELPVELKQLIDAARRLHEEPGLFLNREEIERAIGARLVLKKPTKNTSGWRGLSEVFANERPLAAPFWEGQLAVHTTEFNASSNESTVEAGATVLYRRKDMEALVQRLRARGHQVEDFKIGPTAHALDFHVDVPPTRAMCT